MLLKGNQRGGAKQMAVHLLNGIDNEHVRVAEVSGFIAQDVVGALNEIYATSKGTKCTQFMYSLSLSPPQDQNVPDKEFEKALEQVEKKLGLEGQPRVIVFHEKKGRRHAHCVWSRIDIDQMKAINMSFDRDKLNKISKSLYLEHGWQLPDGFKDKSQKNPLNYSRAEWQQAMRVGKKPQEIKEELREAWCCGESLPEFKKALEEKGFYLAKGDRRGYVAVDIHGEVYSLSKQLGVKKKELEKRLGKSADLPSVEETRSQISSRLSKLFTTYAHELNNIHNKQRSPLLHSKEQMVKKHQDTRAELKDFQEQRWIKEENARARRVRKGFKGLFDKISGRYWKTRKQNEREAWQCLQRDQKQYEKLVFEQLAERRELENKIQAIEKTHAQERKDLMRDLSHIEANEKSKEAEHDLDWFRRTSTDREKSEWGLEDDKGGPELE